MTALKNCNPGRLNRKLQGLYTLEWIRCKLEIITSMKMKYIDEENENLGQNFRESVLKEAKRL